MSERPTGLKRVFIIALTVGGMAAFGAVLSDAFNIPEESGRQSPDIFGNNSPR